MINDSYKTLASPSEGLFKSKGSKFIAYAYPVESDEGAREIVGQLRKTYFDARHHCFAYVLGLEKEYQRSTDDGEPSGTAGKPILNRILSADLTNILIVVVRYFGGTLLGVRGLIKAYKEASADAINNAHIITKTVNQLISLTCTYDDINHVMQLIKDDKIDITSQKFEIDCQLTLSIRQSKYEETITKLKVLKSIKLETK